VATHLARGHAKPSSRGDDLKGYGRRLVLPAVLFAVTVVVYLVLLRASWRFVPGNSDDATLILQGNAIAHGNVLLSGWALSYDSFWTLDALVNAPLVAIFGVSPRLLHIAPALVSTVLVVIGAWAASAGQVGRTRWVGAAVVIGVLAFPSPELATVYLQGGQHVATVLWCLAAVMCLRSGRFGRGWVLGVILLAMGVLGDLQTLGVGVGPVAAAGVAASIRLRRPRAGVPLLAAALASVVGAEAVRLIARLVGTFHIGTANPLPTLSLVWVNLRDLGPYLDALMGLGGAPGDRAPGALVAVHVFALLIIVAGGVLALVSCLRGMAKGTAPGPDDAAGWRLDDLLMFAFLGGLLVFVGLSLGHNIAYYRYLMGAVVYGAVLGGRSLSRASLPSRAATQRTLRRYAPRVLPSAVVLLALLLAAGFAFTLRGKDDGAPQSRLGRFLIARHLTSGLGDYWDASIVTVLSRGTVTIRPAISYTREQIVRYDKESDERWYTDRQFQFLVFKAASPFGRVDITTARATFGTPAHVYAVGRFYVLTWNHPLTVSPALPAHPVKPGSAG
jgi:hypothetical protein